MSDILISLKQVFYIPLSAANNGTQDPTARTVAITTTALLALSFLAYRTRRRAPINKLPSHEQNDGAQERSSLINKLPSHEQNDEAQERSFLIDKLQVLIKQANQKLDEQIKEKRGNLKSMARESSSPKNSSGKTDPTRRNSNEERSFQGLALNHEISELRIQKNSINDIPKLLNNPQTTLEQLEALQEALIRKCDNGFSG